MTDASEPGDSRAVERLVLAYADRIDAGDFEGVARLLADADLTAEGDGRVLHGYDAVLRRYRSTTRLYEDGTPKTKHLTTNLVVDVEHGGAAAACRSYYTVLQAVPGALPLQPVIAGRYADRFERVDGTWRFAHRHILVDLIGDLSHHLLFDLPAS